MTTSGTYSFTVTRDQIIRDAMLNIEKLDEVETPTAQEVTDCNFKLNMLVKQWMGRTDLNPGLKVWTRRRGYLFLNTASGQYDVGPTATGWTNSFVNPLTTAAASAGATSVTLSSVVGVAIGYNIGVSYGSAGALFWTTVSNVVGNVVTLAAQLPGAAASGDDVYVYATAGTRPLNIESALLRDSGNQDTPLQIMRSTQEYDSLTNKTDPLNTADPTGIYYEYHLGNSLLFTDCGAANDTSKYIVLTYMEETQDITNPNDTFDYPPEWFLPLSWGLSKHIAPMFHAAWTPLMEANYREAMAVAGHKDAETTVMYFQPGLE